MAPDISALASQVAELQKQVVALRQQLQGNDPSSQYRNLLQIGGQQAGWFQLTSNGVNTLINNSTNPNTTGPISLESQDISTGDYAVVDPFDFILYYNGDSGGTPGIVAVLTNQGGVGKFSVSNGFNGYAISFDSTAGSLLITDGVGDTVDTTPTKIQLNDIAGNVTVITAAGINTPAIVLTTPLPTTEGGTGSSYANFAALAAAILTAISPISTTKGGTGANYVNFAAIANAVEANESTGITPGTIPLVKLTGGGANGSLTVNAAGRVTGYVDPT